MEAVDWMGPSFLNITTLTYDWVSTVFDVPLVSRAVVFGFPIDGIMPLLPLYSFHLIFLIPFLLLHDKFFVLIVCLGHIVVEVLLIAVILFLLSRKSYKHPKKPLTEKVDLANIFSFIFLMNYTHY